MADAVLHQGVAVTDLMFKPGIINLDFADIRVMTEMGKAMMLLQVKRLAKTSY